MFNVKVQIKLIALDLDGTLLSNELKISEENQQAINKAKSKGIYIIFSTGRPANFCYPLMDKLGLEGYLISSSGGEIWKSKDKLIERNLFAAKEIQKLSTLGKSLGVQQWLTSTKGEFSNIHDIDSFSKHEWLKIGFYSKDQSKLEKLIEKLNSFGGLEITNSHPSNVEVNPEGVNKAVALKKVGEQLGISMDEIMAVGDSLNDKEMIKSSGLGVAMGNAQEKIKQIADYVTDTNENNGVAKVINRFVF